MKRKIKFTNINTAASIIKITLDNGFTVATKSKSDFKSLLKDGIIFDEYDCKDYDDIIISGEKDHLPSYEEASNRYWKEHSKSFIDHIHFGQQEYVDKVSKDANQEVFIKITKDEWYASNTAWYKDFDIDKITTLMQKPTVWLGLALNNSKDNDSISFLKRIVSTQKGFLNLSNVEMPDDLTDISNFAELLNDSNTLDESFKLCERITSLPKFNFELVTNAKDAFKNMTSLESFDTINFPKATDLSGLLMNCQKITEIKSLNIPKAVDTSYMFFGTAIRLFGDLSNETIENTSHMFSDINIFENMGNVDLPNVSDASYMFANCRNLLNKVGNISIPNATTAFGMFQDDFNISTIGNLNLGSATDIFAVDEGQEYCGISNIGNITANSSSYEVDGITYDMFHGLENLSTIGSLDMPLEDCYDGNLETLRSIGNIKSYDGARYSSYFRDCSNLQSVGVIYRPNSNISLAVAIPTLGLFENCSSLSSIRFVNTNNTELVYGIPDTCEVITDDFYNYPADDYGTPVSVIDPIDEYNSTVRIIDGVSHFQYDFNPKLLSNYAWYKINEESISLDEITFEESDINVEVSELEEAQINTDPSKINDYGNPQGIGSYQINAIFNGKKEGDKETITANFRYNYKATVDDIELDCQSTFKMKFNLTFGISETIEYSIVEVDDEGNELR